MAARTRKLTHAEETRQKIKTSQLINRLQGFALGEPNIEMSKSQVSAAVALLKKAIPDLSSVDLGNTDGQPLNIVIRRFSET